ncbi:hypothetical protein SHI21_17700 [Bacteriovorax sp. PP10]|uniref:Uncharacterized protein n=1 Tax=Bacteriovorax antarcticus TaxID=3088717 RepID=A0ABU5VYE8_9BACT|nr:hypothetical protein [Bacteriovorax sp. PP10]MEA9358072.1 hypothetical protein [Bacteriovorax sp. PP10]
MLKLSGLFIAVLFSSALFANEEDHSIEQKLAALKLERMQAEVMIKRMVHSGRMNEVEAVKAKRAIASVKEEDLAVIRTEALETLKSSQSLATK